MTSIVGYLTCVGSPNDFFGGIHIINSGPFMQVSSQRLADDVKKLKGQLSGEVLQLICCFVNPSEMIHEVEQEISTLVYVRRRTTNADHSQCDPIHQFFTTDCSSEG